MAYTPHTWATYEMVTKDGLNHMEEGIAANDAGITTLNTWKNKQSVVNSGTKALSNSQEFPFNNSKQSIALSNALDNTNYDVIIKSITANGNPGEIVISERLVNGFKMAYTGSATSVTVEWAVIGGH